MKTILCPWSLYPCKEVNLLEEYKEGLKDFIVGGNFRSYSDAFLSKNVIKRYNNFLISFDEERGLLEAFASVSLKEVLSFLVKRGYFLYVVPGTSYVSLGGAFSFDIHGKNHHKDGSFCNFVESIKIRTPSNEVKTLTFNDELFWYVCGGAGLFGEIISLKLKLKKIETPFIRQKILKTSSIKELIEKLKENEDYYFSVSWIDAFSKKGVLMLGEWATYEELPLDIKFLIKESFKKKELSIDFFAPNFLLNDLDMRAYSYLTYKKYKEKESFEPYFSYFFPLDNIKNWNKLYGKRGFIQYQYVVPKDKEFFIEKSIDFLRQKGYTPYLAVLKSMSNKSKGVLSFAQEGFTLALDIPIKKGLFDALNILDKELLEIGGKLYLAKDSRMSSKVFWESYKDRAKAFFDKKRELDKELIINSSLSKRLEIT